MAEPQEKSALPDDNRDNTHLNHPEGVDKLAFSAVAAPGSSNGGGTGRDPLDIVDLVQYKSNGPPATRKEVWSYYLFYAADNGIGTFQYSTLLFQNLIYQAAFNPDILPVGSAPCSDDATLPCHVFWGGGNKTKAYASVVLIASGLTFLCQALLFIAIGSLADFGSWNPWVVRVFSVLCWAFEFGFLGVKTPDLWRTAMALYIMSSITWWASYVFFNAIFPKLAHDLPEVHEAREQLLNGSISEDEFSQRASIQRSRIMNISYLWNNVGFVICCGLSLGALFGVRADDSIENNNWGYSVSVAVCTGFWIIFAIPWFLWEKKRPGPKLPQGTNYLTFGAKHFWFALKKCWQLKQTFYYLVAFFLLADGVSTQLTLISIAQTQAVEFSATGNTYFLIVQGACAAIGCGGYYWLQKHFNLKTKTILQIVNFCCLLTAIWGTIGIWTTKIGFHNRWEFWLFAGTYSFHFGPQFSYGQAMMAELVPHGREYLFFSLLGIVSKGSAWIGPIVSSAIVDQSGNQWCAFPFVAALIFVPFVGIFFISVEKSRVECAEYLAREAVDLRKVAPDSASERDQEHGKQEVVQPLSEKTGVS